MVEPHWIAVIPEAPERAAIGGAPLPLLQGDGGTFLEGAIRALRLAGAARVLVAAAEARGPVGVMALREGAEVISLPRRPDSATSYPRPEAPRDLGAKTTPDGTPPDQTPQEQMLQEQMLPDWTPPPFELEALAPWVSGERDPIAPSLLILPVTFPKVALRTLEQLRDFAATTQKGGPDEVRVVQAVHGGVWGMPLAVVGPWLGLGWAELPHARPCAVEDAGATLQVTTLPVYRRLFPDAFRKRFQKW